jgi:hypothetical protein
MISRGLWLTGAVLVLVAALGYALATYWPGFGVA